MRVNLIDVAAIVMLVGVGLYIAGMIQEGDSFNVGRIQQNPNTAHNGRIRSFRGDERRESNDA